MRHGRGVGAVGSAEQDARRPYRCDVRGIDRVQHMVRRGLLPVSTSALREERMAKKRTEIFDRREKLAFEPVRRHQWPNYLVTAAHAAVREGGGDKPAPLPYGEWHARQIGSLQTACGQSAVTWRYFWTLSFDQAGASACPECSRQVLEADACCSMSAQADGRQSARTRKPAKHGP